MTKVKDLFSAVDQAALNKIRNYCIRNQQTIAVAESVTAGLVQFSFSMAKDASRFFQGGLTAYNLGQKARQLSIEPIHALSCDCVSADVSAQMALNVCTVFSSDLGVGITGYASKVPEQEINKLYAYIAIAHKGKIALTKKVNAREAEVPSVQLLYNNTLLKLLSGLLK